MTDLDERIIKEAEYMLENNSTVRKTAEKFGISKSTVHKDVAVKLYYIDYRLYIEVRKLLGTNLKERHIRGGLATKQKYLKMHLS